LSSQAQYAFKQELEKLETLQEEIEKRAGELKKFMREGVKTEEILQNAVKFEELFGRFREKIIVATSIAETFLPPSQLNQPPSEPQKLEETKEEGSRGFFALSIGKVIIAVATLALCYAAVYMDWLPEEVFMWILAATMVLMFLPAILSSFPNLIRYLRRGKEEEAPLRTPAMRLKEVKETLEKIAQDHEWYFWMVREQPYSGPLSRYQSLGTPEEIYITSKQAPLILLFDIPRMVDQILQECTDVIWSRKITIAAASTQRSGTPIEILCSKPFHCSETLNPYTADNTSATTVVTKE